MMILSIHSFDCVLSGVWKCRLIDVLQMEVKIFRSLLSVLCYQQQCNNTIFTLDDNSSFSDWQLKDDSGDMISALPPAQAVTLPYTEVEARLRTNVKTGLSTTEANQRRAFYGVNDFHIDHDDPLWKKYICQVNTGTLWKSQLIIFIDSSLRVMICQIGHTNENELIQDKAYINTVLYVFSLIIDQKLMRYLIKHILCTWKEHF